MVVVLSGSLTPLTVVAVLAGIVIIIVVVGLVLSRASPPRKPPPPAGGPARDPFRAAQREGAPDLSQLMDSFFGGSGSRGARPGVRRGDDVEVPLAIGADEAAAGAVREVRVATTVACAACGGSGASPGTVVQRCDLCDGRGEARTEVKTLLGTATTARRCARCDGYGSLVSRPCRGCGGTGRAAGERTVRFRIPAGVRDGTRVKLAGRGGAGARGAPPGDAYVRVQVRGAAGAATAPRAQPPPRPRAGATAEPVTVRTARVEFTADQVGFVVRNRRGTVSEPWVTHLRAAWVDVDRMEFDVDRHDEVVALYARMRSGDWRYVMDSTHLNAAEWAGLADAVARSTGGRVTLDLSRRRQGPYRPGP